MESVSHTDTHTISCQGPHISSIIRDFHYKRI